MSDGDGLPRLVLTCSRGTCVVALALALAGLAWLVLSPEVCFVTPHSNRALCASRLKQIGLAIGLYRQVNAEALPDRDGTEFLSRLYESGQLPDANVYLCPSGGQSAAASGRLDAGCCSYVGRRNTGALRLTPARLAAIVARTALAADRSLAHHGDVRNVLFADGHVEGLDEAEYSTLYASVLGD